MKTKNTIWLVLVGFLAVPVDAVDSPTATAGTSGPVAQVPSAPALTPAAFSPNVSEVVKLSGSSVAEEVILAFVGNCPLPFNLSANAILRLKEAGVTQPVILAMMTHDSLLRNHSPPAQYAASQQPQLMAPDLPPAGQTPPPAPAEVIPAAPSPDYYWAPGYWGWNGGWIWIGGSWGFRGGYGWGGHYGGAWYGHGGWGGYHGGGGGHGGGHGR